MSWKELIGTDGGNRREEQSENLRKLGTKSRPQEHESAERPRAGGKLASHSETQNPFETREVEPGGTGRKMQHLTPTSRARRESSVEQGDKPSKAEKSAEAIVAKKRGNSRGAKGRRAKEYHAETDSNQSHKVVRNPEP